MMNVLYHYAAGPALQTSLAALSAHGLEVQTCAEDDDPRFFELLPQADVIWHCLRPLDVTVMDRAPKLRLIQKIGVGVNTIDLQAARERGIAVCNMPGTNSQAVAEHALGLMLAVLRQIPAFDALTRAGRGWNRPPELEDNLGEIHGRRVGLIGFGQVPRRLTPILKAMGAEVYYHSQRVKQDAGGTWLSLDELLRRCDIISLHVPLTRETRGLLSAERLQVMRPGSLLINTARGELVDPAALLHALQHGPMRGAGLDVHAPEPIAPEDPILQQPNVVLAPHVAWLTQETLARSLQVARENCRRLERGEALVHRII